MDPYKQLSDSSSSRGQHHSRSSVIVGLIIFLLGVIAGVVGLCVAFKLIFYIGLVVALAAAVALVWFLISLKKD